MNVEIETLPPELDEEGEEDSPPLVGVNVSVMEPEGTYHTASAYLQQEIAKDPEEVAKALIQCALGLAQARGSDTVVALQHQLIRWGTT